LQILREEPRHLIENAKTYRSSDFIEDLEIIKDALNECNLHEVAAYGRFHDLLIRARTFGFHLAALDIRQHSELHAKAIEELLKLAGVTTHM
jgi:phosphoenolpyruvate carboxylase